MNFFMTRVLTLLFSITLFNVSLSAAELLRPVYATFEKEDTSRSLTINFMTEGASQTSFAHYGTSSIGEDSPRVYPYRVRSRIEHIKGVNKTYHHVLLEGLTPNQTYYFKVGDEKIGVSQEYKIQTLPAGNDEIRLLVGGDMSVGDDIVETARAAVTHKPHAIIIGGDIAYANGKVKEEPKWMKWFKQMESIMIDPSGRLIPLILAIGNHETTIGTVLPGNKAPFFFKLFPQNGEKAFFKRKLGANSGLIVLDSGHQTLHRKQVDFLEEALKGYENLPHRFAAYHAPLYPNHRKLNGLWARRGRRYWGKLFDKYRLTVGFEHHDHTLKRTHILRNEAIAVKGTVYVGDGCWGKGAREHNDKWYLKKSTGDTHVWSVKITKDKVILKAMGADAEVFDHFSLQNFEKFTQVNELL